MFLNHVGPEVKEIIGVAETAVDMLVEKRGFPRVTLVGLPKGNVNSGALTVNEGDIELWNVHHH